MAIDSDVDAETAQDSGQNSGKLGHRHGFLVHFDLEIMKDRRRCVANEFRVEKIQGCANVTVASQVRSS